MFFNVKKTQVGWYIDDDVLSHPSLNIEPSVDSTFGCPSIASMVNRYYNVYPQFDAEISFGFKDDKPYYEYKIGKQMNTTNFQLKLTVLNTTPKAALFLGQQFASLTYLAASPQSLLA